MTFEDILAKNVAPVVAMACIVMFVIGIIKIFTKMIIKENKTKLKEIFSNLYILFAVAFSFGLACLYFGCIVKAFDWLQVCKYTAETYACTQALYPIYRDYGGRYLLIKFLGLFKHKNKDLDQILDAIETVLVLTDNQKEQIKDKLK